MLNKVPVSLPIELDYLPEVLKIRAKNELFEDEETTTHSLSLLRSMLNDEPDLHYQNDDEFLLQFLRARKYDVKRAFNVVKNFYTVRNKYKELYDDFDFSTIEKAIESNVIGVLPYRDDEGCVIIYLRPGYAWDPKEVTMEMVMKALTFGLIHAIHFKATQVAGIKVIVDFNGFNLKQLRYITPSYLWLLVEALQNCFPARFRAIHIVNETHLFTYIWSILKNLLTKKIRDRLQFHGKNLTSLHKYFPIEVLPEEYGGELGPYDNTIWGRCMAKTAPYFDYVASFGYKKNKKS